MQTIDVKVLLKDHRLITLMRKVTLRVWHRAISPYIDAKLQYLLLRSVIDETCRGETSLQGFITHAFIQNFCNMFLGHFDQHANCCDYVK